MQSLYSLLFIIIVNIVTINISKAQNNSEKQRIINQTNTKKLQDFSKRKSAEYSQNKEKAVKSANENGWIIKKEYAGGLMELQRLNEFGKPIYYKTFNDEASISVSTNHVWEGGNANLDLDGTGMTIGEWDGGAVLTTHQEFNNTGESRVNLIDRNASPHYHATHVGGTLIAGGVIARAKGMSYNAELDSYDWNNDYSEMALAASEGMLISNHSYGISCGWNWDGDKWEWLGNEYIDTNEDYRFGFYGNDCINIDNIAFNAPYYLIVKSAGNDRGEGAGETGHLKDGGVYGYDCIGYEGNAKNNLSVGAVEDVSNGYTGNPEDVRLTSFSSTGPCDDGRIKPDICGNGAGLYSTYDTNNQAYNSISGTSMSSPNVAGSLLLLQEHFNELYSSFMKSSTIKALVIHTADECGNDEGPDYKFGWGLLNTKTAADVISKKDCSTVIDEKTYDGSTYSFDVTVKGNEPFLVTIAWTDPAGTPVSAQLNPTDIMLVNDLDLTVFDGSTSFYPYKLDGQNPASAATTGNNDIDNVEKIYISNPAAGTYTISVNHEGIITNGTQDFSIIVSGIYNGCTQNFTAVKKGFSEIDISWDLNDENEEVLLVWSTDNDFGTPVNGTIYSSGDEISPGDIVLAYGTEPKTFEHINLKSESTYYYKAYSKKSDNTYTNGTLIHKTLASGVPENFKILEKEYTQIDLSWETNTENNEVLLAWSADNIFGIPDDETKYTTGQSIIGGGEILYFGNSTENYTHSELNHTSNYFYKIWSFLDNKYYSSGIKISSFTKTLIAGIITGKQTVNIGTKEVYQVDRIENVDYNWVTPNNWESEANDEEISIFFKETSGEISVVPSINGQVGKKASLSITVNINFIEELENAGIMLFPNPAKDKISLSFIKEYEELDISIYDIYGKKIYNETLQSPKFHEINSSEFPSGLYFIRFRVDNKNLINTKLIINK